VDGLGETGGLEGVSNVLQAGFKEEARRETALVCDLPPSITLDTRQSKFTKRRKREMSYDERTD
jgi:hypothetical protein